MVPSRPAQVTDIAAPMANSADRLGRVVAVTGAHAVILLDGMNQSNVAGSAPASAEIGNLLKVETDNSIALALVSALSSPMPSHGGDEDEMQIVEVEFIGELPKNEAGQPMMFRRGVSCYPGLGDVVCRASKEELEMAYACDTRTAIRIGYIQQDSSIPAMVKIDDLLGKHFAVLGTTGTGKSCSVALILRRILENNPQAHILLLDVHREYATSFREFAEVIRPDTMHLPFWLLNFEEICEILVSHHSNREVDIEILRDLIPAAKQRYLANQRRDQTSRLRHKDVGDQPGVGIDTPVPYRTSDLVALLEEQIGKLEHKSGLAPYKRLKARVETVTRDPRYSFMFGSLTVQDTMVDVLSRLFRIPVDGRPISILELGGLPSEVINVVVSVLARLAFDFGLYSGGRVPITFVCEEAHRYVPIDRTSGFEPTKRAISRIAKEGRKYGVSLCIVSQRPAELDPTILSQCSTIFSMRLSNENDQAILRAGISDAAASLLEFMPIMGPGEAVTFGEGVSLPTRMKFDLLPSDALPKSATASFTECWANDIVNDAFLPGVVDRWRQQNLARPEDLEPDGEAGETKQDVHAPAAATAQPAPVPTPARPAPAAAQPAAPISPAAPARAATHAAGGAGGGEPSLSQLLRQFRGQQ